MELILKAKDIRVEFKGRDVLDINELEVYDYDRIGLVGANGAGKSTLLRVLLGELTPPGCKMNRLGELAYIPQLDEVTLQEEKDFALVGKLGVEQLNIQTMSGGEETRLKIAQALSAQVHGILADEPTSHLDREGIDFLIGQLKYFTGALLVISHDRYFLDNVADRIFAFDGNGHFRQYEGGYTEYLDAKNRENGSTAEEKSFGARAASGAETASGKKKATWDKGEKKLKFSYKEQKEFETIDDDIAALEQKIEELYAEMAVHASQYSRLAELTEEKEKVQAELDEKMERWMYLTELNEKIEAQK